MMSRRLIQLYAGLILYGAAMALLVRANLGVDPWDVLHLGLARLTGLSFGVVVCLVGAVVLLAWIPLRQRPGLGTISNVVLIGLAADAVLGLLPPVTDLRVRVALLLGGVVLNAAAGAAYIGAGLGPGPRDGLMTGICSRTGWPVRNVRTAIELTVLAVGWLLGGTVGAGTVVYALAIGPLIHLVLPVFTIPARKTSHAVVSSA